MSKYNEIDTLSDIVLLNHNDIVKTIDGTSKGINPIPSFDIAKGISAEVSAVKRDYLPLSGGKMAGDLSIDASKSFYVGDSNTIVISGNTLCSILSNEIALSTSTACKNLSSQLSNDFNFIYDTDTNVLCVSVAGNIKTVSAAKFTEARMLDHVSVDSNAILRLNFKTESGIEDVSVDLHELTPLYHGDDGIDIQYDSGKYHVSADETICRRSDIAALDVENSIKEGYILTSLSQVDGKIEYKQTKLLSSHVEGLTNYVKNAIDDSEQDIRAFTSTLSGNSGVISTLCSTVDTKIKSLDFDNPGFYDDAGNVKVLTSLSQTDGKISASTKVLDYHKIDGLSVAIDAKFDKTGGAIDGSLSVTKSILVNGAISLVNDPTNGGIAIGRNAQLSNEEAFVWSGAGHENIPYYSHGQHTFNINPDNGISGFYIGEDNLASYINNAIDDKTTEYSGLIDSLSDKIDKKIYIEDKISSEISGYSDLSVIKLSSSEYQDLVDSDKTSPSVLYVVESDFINAYGQQIKNLADPHDLSDATNKKYVDTEFEQEAQARQRADLFISSMVDDKAWLSSIPTKTSQLTNDSGYLTAHQSLSDYYTKQQTDEAISSALSSVEAAKYIESEDGTQRIYGNRDVSTLSSAPGTYGPWTDQNGVENTLFHVEQYVFQVQEGYVWTDSQGELGGFSTSREECESMTSFESLTTSRTWTRTYTPGQQSLTKVGELALRSDIVSLSEKIDKKIYIEDKISSEISGYSDLSVIKLSSNDYQDLVDSDATLENALYIVESDFINAYGQQIKNLSAPELSSDAATKGYVDERFNLISSNSILSSVFNSINVGGVGGITLEQSICAIYELVKILGYK